MPETTDIRIEAADHIKRNLVVFADRKFMGAVAAGLRDNAARHQPDQNTYVIQGSTWLYTCTCGEAANECPDAAAQIAVGEAYMGGGAE